MSKKISLILLLLIIVAVVFYFLNKIPQSIAQSSGSTFYVATTGNDTTGNGSLGNPFASISRALSIIKGGDTIIVKNGTYTDRAGMLVNDHYSATIPSGTAQAFTTIKAETPYGVRLKWTGNLNYYDLPVSIGRAQYVHVDGFIYEMLNLSVPSHAVGIGSSHIKITRTIVKRSTVDAYGGWYAIGGDDNLLEDAAGVGAARYGFFAGGTGADSQRNICRRCVGRMDFANTSQPKATFSVYGNNSTTDVRDYFFQNVIAIDGQHPSTNGGEEKYGGFYNPKNASNIFYQGVITLNEGVGHAGMFAQEWGTGINLKNTVIWDLNNSSAWAVGLRANMGKYILADHLTIGGNIPGGYLSSGNSATNSLLGSNNLNNIVNNVSGAVITNRVGVSGTFWGQAGYDQITAESLWPWPYEDKIKAVFSEVNNPPSGFTPATNNTKRGFCADGNGLYGGPITLTSYIWEYLGNPCPPEICSYGSTPPPSDTTPPTRGNSQPTGSLASGVISTAMSLSTNENATCKYSSLPGISYSAMTSNFSATGATSHSITISGLQNGQTYNYYVKCIDIYNNANTNDFTISFSVDSSFKTYYVAINGNNTTGNGSSNNPWQTIKYGIGKMAGGDTLIIKDGTYIDATPASLACDNQIRPPNGTSQQYTTIKAEHDWQAIIDWTGCGSNADGDAPVRIYEYGQTKQYIQIEGLKFINTTNAIYTRSCDHIKLKRLAVISSPSSRIDNNGYGEPFAIVRDSHYVLLEDSWASGSIRYGVIVIGDRGNSSGIDTDHVIIRRVVIRMDYKYPGQPKACFAAYGGEDTLFGSVNNIFFENNICIDWNPENGMTDIYGGFYNPKVTEGVYYKGDIALNLKPGDSNLVGFYPLDNYEQNLGPSSFSNCVVWDIKGMGIYWDEGGISGTRKVEADADQCTLGHLTDRYIFDRKVSGEWIESTLRNSIIDTAGSNNTRLNIEDYNYYNPASLKPAKATNAITGDSKMRYLLRVENDSPLKGAGLGGKDIGANIIYKYGKDGTLWGEEGYDVLTNESLWPWPYEDQIKKDFSTINNPKGLDTRPQINNTKRGFAADGNGLYGGPITLTSYIWEYLGNPCPPEICNYNVTPVTPSITLTLSADKNEIQSGEVLTYTLTYQNTSFSGAKNIIITNPIPQGAAYVANSATNSGVYDAANNRITWTIPSLATGATGAVSFKATVE